MTKKSELKIKPRLFHSHLVNYVFLINIQNKMRSFIDCDLPSRKQIEDVLFAVNYAEILEVIRAARAFLKCSEHWVYDFEPEDKEMFFKLQRCIEALDEKYGTEVEREHKEAG